MWTIVLLLFGGFIGAVARLILPGRHDLSGSATVLVGLLGAGTVGTAVGGLTPGGLVFGGVSFVGSVLGATGFVVAAEWLNRRVRTRSVGTPTAELLAAGEGPRVEYKGSARANLATGEKDARMELAVARTVAAFANSRGGVLLVGVGDEGRPIGLDLDLQLVRGGDRDRYELWVHDLLEGCLGRNALRHVSVRFEELEGRLVCRIDVEAADAPVYLRPHTGERRPRFYVRTGNSTRELDVDDVVDYVRRVWPQGTLSRLGTEARRRLRRLPV